VWTFDDILRANNPPPANLLADTAAQAWSLEREGLGYSAEQIRAAQESLVKYACMVHEGFRVNWHHIVTAEHLERVQRGEIKKLMILEPPQHGKTLLASNLFPAWCLGRADEAIIASAYNTTKARREAKRVLGIMASQAHTAVFPGARVPERSDARLGAERTAESFSLVGRKRASYFASGIGAALTGFSKTLGILDDPVKDWKEAHSSTKCEGVVDWYQSVYGTRDARILADDRGVRDVLIMTPWSGEDLHSWLLQNEPGEWHVLRLPAMVTGDEPDLDPDDPRKPGEALWPDHKSMDDLRRMQARSPTMFQALYQCRPSKPGGQLFRLSAFGTHRAADIPQGNWMISVDATFGGSTSGQKRDTHSYVAIQVWCITPNRAYLAHATRGKWSFLETLERIKAVRAAHPKVIEILVEDKANGPAIIETLRQHVPGVVPFSPNGSKIARAASVLPFIESGAVSLPHEDEAEWVREFRSVVEQFPSGPYDDPVDAMTQALTRLGNNPMSVWDVFS
jgi:predicted phage terminase large subunit-like protein